ncbi:hypothetical protein FXO37_32903 [Capsicum annuum]|nr:hypothetical protein FXO37_32903 [Capsicum annuum]
MKWLCTILKEASKDKEKGIRRWKYKEKFSKTFCTRKVNEYGRFMSILTLNGLERSVLIVPELALNEGWSEVAFKIERFIQCPHQLKNVVQPRLFKRDLPYVKAVGESKWKSNTLGETTISYNEGDLQVTVSPGAKDTRLSRRCTVDSFKKGETELPSLLDMRRGKKSSIGVAGAGEYSKESKGPPSTSDQWVKDLSSTGKGQKSVLNSDRSEFRKVTWGTFDSSANVIFNDLSGPREEGFFDPLGFETKEQVPTLIRSFLESEIVVDVVYVGQGTPVADPRDNAIRLPETEAMEESSGIEVAQSKSGIIISQRKYALDILKETGMMGCRPIDTPMDQNAKFLPGQGESLSDTGRYRRLVGKLNYLTVTRPGISFSIAMGFNVNSLTAGLEEKDGEKRLYRLAKARERKGHDFDQVKCIKGEDGSVLVEDSGVHRSVRGIELGELEHSEKSRVFSYCRRFKVEKVRETIRRMRRGRATGPDEILGNGEIDEDVSNVLEQVG